MARKSAPDWDAIKRDYRTAQFSNRELGRLYGVAESTIRTRAANRKWQQDLSGAVRQEIDIQLSRDVAPGIASPAAAQCAQQTAHRAHPTLAPARATVSTDAAPTDAAIVEAAARRGADVVRGHRAGAARLRVQLDRLGAMVEGRLQDLEQRLAQGAALRDDNLIGCAELLDTMARTFARLAATERQAFNLDGKPGSAPIGLDDDERRVLTAEQRLAALQSLRARAGTAQPAAPASGAVH